MPDASGYRPSIIPGTIFLYDSQEPVAVPDLLAEEWASYCNPVTQTDTKKLLNKFSAKDLNNLYYHLEKPTAEDPRFGETKQHDRLASCAAKTSEALGWYSVRETGEPLAYGGESEWDIPQRDSLKMAKLIKGGQQLLPQRRKTSSNRNTFTSSSGWRTTAAGMPM